MKIPSRMLFEKKAPIMPPHFRLIKRHEQPTTNWSGGTTTQLAIYPEHASYLERTFVWRLSTAKVEIEESTFTLLPGFDRIIMPLEGQIQLTHEQQHQCSLKPFEQESFYGGWTTHCKGKCRDFNLMMKKDGCQGSLQHIHLKQEESTTISMKQECTTLNYN